jgi:glycosyltransferase involved in cell wall biosynthesis
MKISVITPCYNGAAYLRDTIESVLNQTFPPFEYLIVNDGSTDNSLEIAASFADRVSIVSKPNGGLCSARNFGLERTSGDYILFLDADDLLYPQALEQLARGALNSPASIQMMGATYFRDTPRNAVRTRMPDFEQFLPEILVRNLVPPLCWLVPREVANRVGYFDTGLRYLEDWDYWVRAALAGAALHNCHFVGALYRVHAASMTRTADQRVWYLCQATIVRKMVEHAVEFPAFTREYGDVVFWSAATALRACRKSGSTWNDPELVRLTRLVDRMLGLFQPRSRSARIAKHVGIRNVTRAGALLSSFQAGSNAEG